MKIRLHFIALFIFLPSVSFSATNPYLPYPFIDITHGIPSWVYNCGKCNNCNSCNCNNCDDETNRAPEGKGAYVHSFDNSSQDGKIYYQTYTQTGTGVTIATVPKKTKKNSSAVNRQSNTVTYETIAK